MLENSRFTLSVIIPCFNEINTIEEIIKRVRNKIQIIESPQSDIKKEGLKFPCKEDKNLHFSM